MSTLFPDLSNVVTDEQLGSLGLQRFQPVFQGGPKRLPLLDVDAFQFSKKPGASASTVALVLVAGLLALAVLR